MRSPRKQELLIVTLIMILAAFLRFWQINSIPPGLYPDEAMNGVNGLQALQSGQIKPFYAENNGREGLFINIQAVSVAIFGQEAWALRIVSAILGTLTILGLYLLTKEIFGKKTAYLAAFFLAVSFWHINFSRIGFRAIMAPFCIVFTFYFLFKALKTSKTWNYAWAGVFMGLGMQTYTAFRFVPILAVLVLVVYLWHWRRERHPKKTNARWWRREFLMKNGFWKWFFFVGVSLAVFLPLGFYFLQHPQDFFGRAGEVSIFSSPSPLRALINSTLLSLQKFFWHGDFNWRHNLSGTPELLWPVGILFVIGIAISVREMIRRGAKALGHWFLIAGFVLLSLPEILTNEGLPHALRAIGSIPFVFMLTGLGADLLMSESLFRKKAHQALFSGLLIIILGGIGFLGFFQYFYLWGNRPEVRDAFSQSFVDIGNYLNGLPAGSGKTVITNGGGIPADGLPMSAQTVRFLTYGKSRINYLAPEAVNEESVGNACQNGGVIVPMTDNQELFGLLESLRPQGKTAETDKSFKVFKCE